MQWPRTWLCRVPQPPPAAVHAKGSNRCNRQQQQQKQEHVHSHPLLHCQGRSCCSCKVEKHEPLKGARAMWSLVSHAHCWCFRNEFLHMPSLLSGCCAPGFKNLCPCLLKLALLFVQLCFPCLAQLLILLLNCHLQQQQQQSECARPTQRAERHDRRPKRGSQRRGVLCVACRRDVFCTCCLRRATAACSAGSGAAASGAAGCCRAASAAYSGRQVGLPPIEGGCCCPLLTRSCFRLL